MKRTLEFILGLVGGCLFTLIALIALVGAVVYDDPGFLLVQGQTSAVSSAVIVILLALLGLAGAIFVNKKNTMCGIFMLVSGVVGLSASGFPWSVCWCVPLIVAGVMACLPKTVKKSVSNTVI
jgi:hypothetical protein